MLLRHTSSEVLERKALTLNPAKTCQPIGALYAALGIHKCMPHSHGSQGCCSYHRSTLTRHYKEPVLAATSSFTEGSSVFGGQANLLQAIANIFSIYDPDVVAIHTTCLSETIGDDIPQIVSKAKDEGMVPKGKTIIHANTPSYVGSHVTGFSNMAAGIVNYLAETSGEKKNERLNIVPGWVEPSDMREIKRLIGAMGIDFQMALDTSGVLDTPMTGKSEMYPKGGVTVEEVRTMGDSHYTLALGPTASDAAGRVLENKCGVPCETLELPIGLQATDRFIHRIHQLYHVEVPESICDERGRLLDFMIDMSQYFHGKRVALWGDPDQLVSLTEFLVDLGMRPVYIVTGTPGKQFERRITPILESSVPEAKAVQGAGADMFLMHQWIKNDPVDLLIGNTYGKYISRDEDIPFLRNGFPILDRVGHQYFPTVGYQGAIRLMEQMLNLILDRKDRESPEESFELVM
jgi:nitrogenase molybdenum-iron protein beta chain